MNLQRSKLISSIINVSTRQQDRQDAAISILKSDNPNVSDQDLRLHLLRRAAYWEVSGMLKMAFLPDFIRIPIITSYDARLRHNLRMFIQSSVDQLVRKELQAALGIASATVIPIPNAVSSFLDRYSRSSLEEALDGMRDEFSSLPQLIITILQI